MRLHTREKGSLLPGLIVFIVTFAILASAVGMMIVTLLQSTLRTHESEMALNIAEAGANYYLWHMNHNNADVKDGNSTPATQQALGYGPYTHDYYDSHGDKQGKFTLWVKPGALGATTVTVRSIGIVKGVKSDITRSVEVTIGAPSFSTYAVAGNTALWFGNTESTSGPIHSNVGIKMDGANTDQITSAQSTYLVPSWSGTGANTTKAGVWCDSAITTPVSCATRLKTSWAYPVPAVDFNKLGADLCQMKKIATANQASNACNLMPARTAGYIPPTSTTSYSSTMGYLITLNSDNTYNLEKVTNEKDTNTTYATALTRTVVANNIAVPATGVIFVEDNVWVRSNTGGYDGRVTIASARLAAPGDTDIIIAGNLLYTEKYSGKDTIGLVTEDSVEVAPYVGSNVEVDAALIAKSGSVGIRRTYKGTSTYVKGYALSTQGLVYFGSLASNLEWTWSVQLCGTVMNAGCWAGYRYTSTNYDENLRYLPPPSFPVTSTYDILSWREVVANP